MPLVINGATSGSTTIQATDAVTQTLTLPNATGTVALTSTVASTAFRTRVYTSGTTYTPATNVKAFYAFVYGAQGGKNSFLNSGGCGGAGYSEKYYPSPSGSYTFSIGAAGTTAGTAGGTTTFDVMSVTGSNGVTSATGSAGGVGSGGDFNASGGTGGNGATSNGGGGGGAGTRAGNGGNGGNAVANTSAGAGGGTGGNNASGATSGVAATTKAAGALNLSQTLGVDQESWTGGSNPNAGNFQAGGRGATPENFTNLPYLWVSVGNVAALNKGALGGNESGNSTAGSNTAGVIIIELF